MCKVFPSVSEVKPPLGSFSGLCCSGKKSSDVFGKWHHYQYIRGSSMDRDICLNWAHFANYNLVVMVLLQKKRQINHQ